ncbi:hypothetical protein KCU73_g315, partial [Aureobasidium melanogenum]
MRNDQMNYLWIALLSLAGSTVSEKAKCGDGVELNMQQGDSSTFSIPLNETCSAALITFSDGTDLTLDLQTNSSCPYASLEAQTFTTVIGSDTPEGIATLTFHCSEQVYCMSIDVVTANNSNSETSIQSVCADVTNPARESGVAAGVTQVSRISNGLMHAGGMMTSATTPSSPTQAPQGNWTVATALVGASTGFSTIHGASVLGNNTNATTLASPDGVQSPSPDVSAMSTGTDSTATTMAAAFSSDASYSSTSQTVTASLGGSDDMNPTLTTAAMLPTATSSLGASGTTSIETANQLPGENRPTGSKPTDNRTAPPVAAQSLGNGTATNLPTEVDGQGPSTCACYPLPTF